MWCVISGDFTMATYCTRSITIIFSLQTDNTFYMINSILQSNWSVQLSNAEFSIRNEMNIN